MRKTNKAKLILSKYPEEQRTLEAYDTLMMLSHETLDMMLGDLGVDCNLQSIKEIRQLDLEIERELDRLLINIMRMP